MPKPLAMTYTQIMPVFGNRHKNQEQDALSRVITFQSWTKTLLMKEHPFQWFTHHQFPPRGAINIEDFAIYLHCALQSTFL